ncbi:MAG: FGGY-family carbohydrate kinase, partial [Planctomycetia bacterium]
ACVVGLNDRNATPGNVAKAMLLATIFNLKLGSDELDRQGFPRTEIVLSGGLTKTPALGQILADACNTPVVILDGAAEGTAWGAALLAKYRSLAIAGRAPDWAAFLAGHATGTPRRFTPRPPATAVYHALEKRYRRLVALHGQLGAAVG